MATVSLSADSRDLKGKGAARKLRSQGQIPAVIYGHGRDPQSLALNARDLDKLLSHISGREHRHRGHGRRSHRQDADPRDPAPPDQAPDPARRLPGARRRRESHRQHSDRAHRHAEGVRLERWSSRPDSARDRNRSRSVEHPESHRVDVTNMVIGDSVHVSDLKVPEGVEVHGRSGSVGLPCSPRRAP